MSAHLALEVSGILRRHVAVHGALEVAVDEDDRSFGTAMNRRPSALLGEV
jgi:hypothetical protein